MSADGDRGVRRGLQSPVGLSNAERRQGARAGEIFATVNNREVRLASVRRIEEIIDKQARSKGASRGECREMANEFFARLNGGCQ